MASRRAQVTLQEDLSKAILAQADFDIIDSILEQWPDVVKQSDEKGNLPLHLAAMKSWNDCAVIKRLLQLWPESIQQRNCAGFHPLLTACCHTGNDNSDVIKVLIRAHPPALAMSLSDSFVMTPLQYAIGHMDRSMILYMLLQYPEALHIQREGELPLHSTFICQRELELIEEIASRWPRTLKCPNFHQELPLHVAARHASLDCISFLVEEYPEALGAMDREGNTPIHVALVTYASQTSTEARLDKASNIRFLAAKCPQTVLRQPNKEDLLPYQMALHLQLIEIVDLLLPAKKQSPLHAALDYEHTPPTTIFALIRKYPEQLRERSTSTLSSRDLPLHLLLRRDRKSVV